MKLKSLFFLIAGLFLLGCNYEFSNTSETAKNSGNSNTQTNQAAKNGTNAETSNKTNAESGNADGAKLILSDIGKTATVPCSGREVEVDESATANNYTLTGECKSLTVDGVSNKIKVDKVGAISVAGTSNKIVYGEGLNNQKPKIKKSGTDTSVETIKAQEEKQAAAAKKVS